MYVDRLVLTDAFEQLLRRVRTLVDDDLRARAVLARQTREVPSDVLRLLGQSGLLGLRLPEEAGGTGCSHFDYFQLLEELGTVWPELALVVSSHDLACDVLVRGARSDQRAQLLDRLLCGDVVADRWMVEMPSTSDRPVVRTDAVRGADGYVLSGRREAVWFRSPVDVHVLLARLAHEGDERVAWFIVPACDMALHPGGTPRIVGCSTVGGASAEFSDVRVPSASRLGIGGADPAGLREGIELARLGVAAVATGIAQAAVDTVVDLIEQGALSRDEDRTAVMLAGMAAATEASRATYLSAARSRDCGLATSRTIDVARLVATENARSATSRAADLTGRSDRGSASTLRHLQRHCAMLSTMDGDERTHHLQVGRAFIPSNPDRVESPARGGPAAYEPG